MSEPVVQPLLSVLIATLAKREAMFLKLLDGLLAQAEESPEPVEVVALQNAGEKTLAQYRDALLRDARGEYLCFADDDDQVPDYYIAEIVKALESRPDVVGFEAECRGVGGRENEHPFPRAPRTLFSLRYVRSAWYPVPVDGIPSYLKPFSHLLPVRSEIARKGGFIHTRGVGFTGEDMDYVGSVLPHLYYGGAQEVIIPRVMYHYLWLSAGETTQDGPQSPGLIARYRDHPRPVITSPCFRWCGR